MERRRTAIKAPVSDPHHAIIKEFWFTSNDEHMSAALGTQRRALYEAANLMNVDLLTAVPGKFRRWRRQRSWGCKRDMWTAVLSDGPDACASRAHG